MPLILFNHGGGDDVMQYLDEIGALVVAEHERVAIVAPYHSGTNDLPGTLTALIRYMPSSGASTAIPWRWSTT